MAKKNLKLYVWEDVLLTDEQARLIGESAGKAFAEALIKWLNQANRHPAVIVGAQAVIQMFGEAIGKGIKGS